MRKLLVLRHAGCCRVLLTTTYTLSCTGIDSSPVYEIEVVDITPFFEEK